MLLAALLLQASASLWPRATERLYARAFYPRLIAALSAFSRGFGFSLGEVVFALLLTAALLCVAWFCVGLYRRRGERLAAGLRK